MMPKLTYGAVRRLLSFLLLSHLALAGIEAQRPTDSLSHESVQVLTVRDMSAEDIFSRFAGRIVFLTCEITTKETSLASGVLVSGDGLIMTNAHVIDGCRSIEALQINGGARREFAAVALYSNSQKDVAVLKISLQGKDYFDLRVRPSRIGERVYSIASPRGLEQSISEGIISGNREDAGVEWIQHSAPISPGSSGGALISARGELLGINSFLMRDSQNLNFAVPSATLAEALSAARDLTRALSLPSQQATPVFPSPEQAKEWRETAEKGGAGAVVALRHAAELGSAVAQLNLGFLYNEGHGVPKDDGQAASWYFKAAEQNHAGAQLSLGAAFELGKGVSQDYAQAAGWYRKAANQGNAEGELFLGYLYESGQGVRQDYFQAAHWIRKAAEQGHATAHNKLGLMYHEGRGVPKDHTQEAAWYRRAAEQGYAEAQLNLGVFYWSYSVPRNYSESYFWVGLAAKGQLNGVKTGRTVTLLAEISAHLTPAELSGAQRRMHEWLANHRR